MRLNIGDNMKMSEILKILSIDGGGFRGVYSAHLEERIQESRIA